MGETENSTLEQELIKDLTEELEISDANFNASLLASKIKNAIREIKTERKYPASYTEEMIISDLWQFYSNCRAIALYDYNKIGIDFETSHTESSIGSTFVDRNKLFAGVIPLAKRNGI